MIDSGLSQGLWQHVYDEFCGTCGTFWLGGDKYRLAGSAEVAALGCDDEDTVICRESDGAFFAVQFSAHVVPLLPAGDRVHAAAKLPGDCCWVLWGKCGCAFGVTTGRLGDDLMTVTEDEAWRSLYEDWGRAEADKADGYRIELMTFDRYKADVAPKMLVRCPHRPEPAGQPELPEVAQ